MPLRKAYAGEGRLPPIIPAARGARRTTPAGSETEARVEEARMRSAALLADRLQSVRHRLCDGGGARAEVAHQLERIYEHSAADVDGLRGEAREEPCDVALRREADCNPEGENAHPEGGGLQSGGRRIVIQRSLPIGGQAWGLVRIVIQRSLPIGGQAWGAG